MLMTICYKERCPKQLTVDSITNEWARNMEVKNATVKGKNKSKGLDRRPPRYRSRLKAALAKTCENGRLQLIPEMGYKFVSSPAFWAQTPVPSGHPL